MTRFFTYVCLLMKCCFLHASWCSLIPEAAMSVFVELNSNKKKNKHLLIQKFPFIPLGREEYILRIQNILGRAYCKCLEGAKRSHSFRFIFVECYLGLLFFVTFLLLLFFFCRCSCWPDNRDEDDYHYDDGGVDDGVGSRGAGCDNDACYENNDGDGGGGDDDDDDDGDDDDDDDDDDDGSGGGGGGGGGGDDDDDDDDKLLLLLLVFFHM